MIGIPIWITRSTIGLKILAITARIKKKKKHSKTVLLPKSKLNIINLLMSRALIDSCIGHDEFVFKNSVLKEYNEMKEEMSKIERLNQVYWRF